MMRARLVSISDSLISRNLCGMMDPTRPEMSTKSMCTPATRRKQAFQGFCSWHKASTSFLLLAVMATIVGQAAALAQPVAVIGATGRLGRLVVQELIAQNIPCRLLVRSLPSGAGATTTPSTINDCESSEELLHYFSNQPNVQLLKGDVSNAEALTELVTDCRACLALWGSTRKSKISDLWSKPEDTDPTHAKQVNYQGVLNLIQACQKQNCKRIVRITGKGEDPTGLFTVLINLLGSMAKAWNYQGEQALREAAASGKIEYTIIRPGVMSMDAPAPPKVALQLADDGGDLPVSRICYQDIAQLCVDCLEFPNAANCTLTAMTTAGSGEASWKSLLAKVQADRRLFPSDMLEQHYAAVRSVLVKGVAASLIVVGVAIKLLVL